MATRADQARRYARQALPLVLLAAALTLALTALERCTAGRTVRNEQAWVHQHLQALLPAGSYDNDLLADAIEITSPDLAPPGRSVRLYRARRGGAAVAAAIRAVAPDGYHSPIELLVAIRHDGTLIGVQVLRHQETPGLGDAFVRQPQWLAAFAGRSLSDPPAHRWTVRKEGGDFDAFTGATITSRAIVKAVRRALEYHQRHRDWIYSEPPA